MWKMLVAFAVFAAIVIFVLLKTNAEVDMGGEKHGTEATTSAQEAPQVPDPTTSAVVAPPAQTASPASAVGH